MTNIPFHLVALLCVGLGVTTTLSAERRSAYETPSGVRHSKYVPTRALTASTFRERVQILRKKNSFDGSVKMAKRLCSVVGIELGSDKATPGWRDAILDRADFQNLEGYSLAREPVLIGAHAEKATAIQQRLEILSDAGETLRVTLLYTESPQQARIQLLDYFSNTSMGLGQHLWNLTGIQGGVGETCLIAVLMKFAPNSDSLEHPTDVELLDSSVVFFRAGIAVQIVNLGRTNDRPAEKRHRSAMGFAGKIDEMLIEKMPRSEDGNREQQDSASVTLENVVYCHGGSPSQQPLMCLPGKDFPEGREMTFRDPESGEFVHAVFPKAAAAPENLDGSFVLHGRFQGIQNWDAFAPSDARPVMKIPPKDYRYFVVSSWEHRE